MKKSKSSLEQTGESRRRDRQSPGGPAASTRGSSMQGERQSAKGGPAGANQGGAPRGSSRLEPSHQKRALKQDRKGR